MYFFGDWVTPQMHFGGYDSWADTPSNDPVAFDCNASLF
jgi:hypothetical protein